MFIWLMIHERLLAAVSEAFHILVSPFHETIIDVSDPKRRSQCESKPDGEQDRVGDRFTQKCIQHRIQDQWDTESSEVDNHLYGTVGLAACHFLVQCYGLLIVNSQLEETKIDKTGGIEEPGKDTQ